MNRAASIPTPMPESKIEQPMNFMGYPETKRVEVSIGENMMVLQIAGA